MSATDVTPDIAEASRFPPHMPPREKASLAFEIVAAYVTARWWLSRRGLDGAMAAIRERAGRRALPWGEVSYEDQLRLARATVRTISWLPSDSRCLMRSLVVASILERRGVDVKVVIGVKPGFEAHAWVEREDGLPLLATGDDYGRLTEV